VVATPVSGVIVSLVVALRNEHERVLRLEQSDALTGLPNRRAFFDLALRALAMAQRNHQPWAVAVLDLDDFKTVNDRHGHAVGDQLLAGAAQACLGAVRASDVVARWGGEEIVLLLVGAGPRDAAAVLERTRAAIQQRTVHVDGGGEVRRTASIGVALGDHLSQAPVSQAWLETFIARADAAMYRAKRSGKNRVVFWNAADRETEREVDRAAN
jgi:diguanylate cyclase (GGDEF)-like protein